MCFLDKNQIFVKFILSWWDTNRRDFPWRRTTNAYRLLITEVLLRKTTAKQVSSIYLEFFKNYSTITDLAEAEIDELETILYPLGMEKKRSKELSKMAKFIVEEYNGKIPPEIDQLMELYGVGRYTASGVLCQAYKVDHAMVDTNVVRVMERYFGFKSSKKRPRDDPELWSFTTTLIPKGKCKEFNLGLIDFAGDICNSRSPRCDLCKLSECCNYFKTN